MRSRYKIDNFQASNFVTESFDQLFATTASDFTPIYREVCELPVLEAGAVLPGERTYTANLTAR